MQEHYSFSTALISCSQRAEIKKTVDVIFCGSAKTVSNVPIDEYQGIFGV